MATQYVVSFGFATLTCQLLPGICRKLMRGLIFLRVIMPQDAHKCKNSFDNLSFKNTKYKLYIPTGQFDNLIFISWAIDILTFNLNTSWGCRV